MERGTEERRRLVTELSGQYVNAVINKKPKGIELRLRHRDGTDDAIFWPYF